MEPKSQFELESRFNKHTHNGVNAQKINFSDIDITPLSTISDPSGGATQDAEARSAINDIIDRLQSLGLIE